MSSQVFLVFYAALFVAVAGEGADYVVVYAAMVGGGGDAGAPPCAVLLEAGLYALFVAFDEAEVVAGLVLFVAQGSGSGGGRSFQFFGLQFRWRKEHRAFADKPLCYRFFLY